MDFNFGRNGPAETAGVQQGFSAAHTRKVRLILLAD